MLEISDNILVESLSEALETMAFMMVMPPEEELPAPEQSIRVDMNFTGPVRGKVELMAGLDFTWNMAANVMGLDPDDEEAKSKGTDAFKELVNTVCGVLLPKLASSPKDIFDVSIPKAQNFETTDDWNNFIAQSDVRVLDVDCQPVAVRLTIDS